MRRTLFSQSWHNVADLQPKLAPHARIFRHTYRKQPWFVIQDSAGGRYHRISPQAHIFLSRMDGVTTVQTLWDEACQEGGEYIPTQDDIVQLLMQLHANDLLYCDVTPDAAELFDRFNKRRKAKWKQWLTSPTSLRIPLINPDAFLSRWVHRLAWIFNRGGALAWLCIVVPALVLAGQHWTELTENMSDRVLSTHNLIALALVYPFVKAIHELGHGFATKVWGGNVHEMGFMFLVFAPVPYVDASAAATFQSRYQRAIVGAAGMMSEMLIAALAMYVWVNIEPGWVRAVAYNVMLIAGVSTLVVNGNPLLRYDGYYILSDLIEIPNLAQRGTTYLTYLSDRYLFGARDAESPQETPSEKRWLAIYTPLAWFYRIVVAVSITLFIAAKFFFFGVILGLWSAFQLICLPVWKSAKHIISSPTLRRQRTWALQLSLGLLITLILTFSLVPMPLRTQAEGVVWLPEQSLLRAGVNGFFVRLLVEPGSHVVKDTPVLLMSDPSLDAELAIANAKVSEAESRYRIEQFTRPSEANVVLQQLQYEKQARDRISERYDNLIIYSQAEGILTIQQPKDLDGQFYKKGTLIGYVLNKQDLVARVVVTQDDIDLVRTRLQTMQLRFSDSIAETYTIHTLREVPSGIDELPSAALSPNGGGKIAVDPKDPNGLKTLGRIFLFDLSLPEHVRPSAFGQRVFVRFDHKKEPIFAQWYRRLRQLFLSRFNV